MKNKLLSVVIPAYNISQYLEKSVQSLKRMLDNSKVEIIIINDGSTDNTLQVAKVLAGKYKNIIVYSKSNGGLSDARNYGNLYATGKYIYFFDGDDYLNSFSELLLSILETKEPDMLCFGYNKMDDNGKILSSHLLRYNSKRELEELTFEETLKLIVGRSDEPIAGYLPTKIIKHELIADQRFLDMNYEDLPFIFALAERVPFSITYLNLPVYNYVQRKTSITHTITEKNLLDKLLSIKLVRISLKKLKVSPTITNLNNYRSLIGILWVSSLNRKIKSSKVAEEANRQLFLLIGWVMRKHNVRFYVRLKSLYYLINNSIVRRKR